MPSLVILYCNSLLHSYFHLNSHAESEIGLVKIPVIILAKRSTLLQYTATIRFANFVISAVVNLNLFILNLT